MTDTRSTARRGSGTAPAPRRSGSAPAAAAAGAVPAQGRAPDGALRGTRAGTPEDGREDLWTEQELAEVRDQLATQATALRAELAVAQRESAAAKRAASGEGSGDEADAGAKTFEREHELSLAANGRELLQQVERALARMVDGTWGSCERCRSAIPKPRLQAAPRATLCVACKQREERR